MLWPTMSDYQDAIQNPRWRSWMKNSDKVDQSWMH